MSNSETSLKAPNGISIIGIKLLGGDISSFEFIRKDDTSIYTLPPGNSAKVDRSAGESILVDAEGGEWPASDVEYHSLFVK